MSKKTPNHLTSLPDPKAMATKNSSFKGYTMEELRYQKALALLRKEFCKSNVIESVDSLRHPMRSDSKRIAAFTDKVPAKSSDSGSALKQAGKIGKLVFSTLTKGMKPLDYVMFGISLIGPARKLIKSLRKK